MAMVCLCHGISERRIRRAVDTGAMTVAEVGERCRAGTTCHGCHPTIEELLDVAVSVRPRPAFA